MRFLIWIRGLMLNNLDFSMALFWLMVLGLIVFFVYQVYKWRKTGRLNKIWVVIFSIIAILNLIIYFFRWPGGLTIILITSTLPYIPIIWWSIIVLSILASVALLVFVLKPELADKLFKKKKGIIPLSLLVAYVCFDLLGRSFFLVGYTFFTDGQALWPAVRKTAELANALKVEGNLPKSKSELKQMKPTEVKLLEAYGKFCYFYDEETNDFTMVTKFSGNWHLHNRQYDRKLIDENDETYRELVESCK